MGAMIDHFAGGEHGHFIGNHLLGLSKQAKIFGAVSPADHLEKAEQAADRQAAYVAGLEQAIESMSDTFYGPIGPTVRISLK